MSGEEALVEVAVDSLYGAGTVPGQWAPRGLASRNTGLLAAEGWQIVQDGAFDSRSNKRQALPGLETSEATALWCSRSGCS